MEKEMTQRFFKRFIFSLIPCLILVSGLSQSQPLEVIIHPAQSDNDQRDLNIIEILTTALDKTVATDGPYTLRRLKQKMNQWRYKHEFVNGQKMNLIWGPPSEELISNSLPIPIPLLKGLLGYRVFLINKDDQEKFSAINKLSELKLMAAGHEKSWVDTEILRLNGFNLVLGSNYEGLFSMLKYKRFDYFPRGANEVIEEFDIRRKSFPDMRIEKDLLLFYPYPLFFFVKNNHQELADRITRGLNIMIKDGSFDAITYKYNGDDIKTLNLKNRKLFKIGNPLLPDIVPFDREELWLKLDLE
jgi:hypothetical protein